MCKRVFLIISFILLFFLSFTVIYSAAKLALKVQGNWNLGQITDNDLTGGAGSDFPSTWESPSDKVDIDVTKSENYWEVRVSKTDNPWPSGVQVWVRRTTDGDASPPTTEITGGTTYQQVTGTDQPFFSGHGDITGIKVQVKLENMSVSIGEDGFTTELSYTCTDGYNDWP